MCDDFGSDAVLQEGALHFEVKFFVLFTSKRLNLEQKK
jgi:hypothetical protein